MTPISTSISKELMLFEMLDLSPFQKAGKCKGWDTTLSDCCGSSKREPFNGFWAGRTNCLFSTWKITTVSWISNDDITAEGDQFNGETHFCFPHHPPPPEISLVLPVAQKTGGQERSRAAPECQTSRKALAFFPWQENAWTKYSIYRGLRLEEFLLKWISTTTLNT